MKRPRPQLDLPLQVTLSPPATPETDSVYMAVMYLRSAGRTVYRAGKNVHLVAGKFVTTQRLIIMGGSQWISSSSSRAS